MPKGAAPLKCGCKELFQNPCDQLEKKRFYLFTGFCVCPEVRRISDPFDLEDPRFAIKLRFEQSRDVFLGY